ncbi:anti-sigma factor [Arthrobacter sp. B3I4]|uniref:anti-sigma factor family protein n=1 Tax=Arthrobacter sp. B3I4 TaxID=3042267 RepID=UPI002788F5F1|nr:zf-HC2 domain-containing protein [Arthrobacter sp. B3I4]MDQ0754982.1 hypothetical protein [Arthrobacter sp. B3I4]
MNSPDLHQLLGAYLLGGLPLEEAAEFERHLAGCSDCRTELDRLASLPALLDAVPVADALALTAAAPGPAAALPDPLPGRMLDRVAARRRSVRRRWTAALAAVAAVCLGLGIQAAPLLNQPPKADASYSVQVNDGLQITVDMVKKTWGTELSVEGRSLPVDGTFSLWVRDHDGGEDRACAWTATPSGKVKITGATPLQLARISSVEMRNGQQQTLAVIGVPHG